MFDRIPFVRYTIFLLAGIFGAEFVELTDPRMAGAVLLAVVGTAAWLLFSSIRSRFTHYAFLFSLSVLGWFAANQQKVRLKELLHKADNHPHDAFVATITNLPEKRPNSYRLQARIDYLINGSSCVTLNGNCLISIKADPDQLPEPGDRIMVRGKLQRPPEPASPFSFDYRKYLERRGIPFTVYIADLHRVSKLDNSPGQFYWAEKVTALTDQILRKYIPDDDAYGLTKAMILGRRDDIRTELNDAFIQSGTVHILSVSGLHVAIFFAVLHFLMSPLRRTRGGTYLYLGLMVVILASYAIITGLPASVQRATLMCILWLLATTFSRHREPVNTLAVAAFFILLADPASFYDVGFQLSFLAMLGIFLWSEPLSGIFQPQNRIIRHFWSLTVMSLAAQLMTLPLTTYYFHQFPTYFLLSNLLAVDLSGLLIPASLALIVAGFAGIPFLANWIGILVNFLANLVNAIVGIPGKLPHFLLTHLYLDLPQTIGLLVLILFGYAAVRTRNPVWVRGVAIGCVVFTCYSITLIMRDSRSSFMQSTSDHTALLYKSGSLLYVFENNPGNSFRQYEIDKITARYRTDTLLIRVY